MSSRCSQLSKLSYGRILSEGMMWLRRKREIPTITDLCLRVQFCVVQAMGKVLGTMALQERGRWLNLADLSE